MGSRSTLSSPPPSKVQCIDRSFLSLSVVFNSGFLSWHDLSQIQSVCKEWKEIARGAMPNDAYFEEVFNYLDQWNGCNKHCWNCSGVKFADTGDEEEAVCICDNDDGSGDDDSWSSEKDFDLGLWEKDPRNKHPNYHEKSFYEKARLLYQFHAECVQNLQSYLSKDPTEHASTLLFSNIGTQWQTFGSNPEDTDYFFGMKSFRLMNPKAFHFFLSLVDLQFAKIRLRYFSKMLSPFFLDAKKPGDDHPRTNSLAYIMIYSQHQGAIIVNFWEEAKRFRFTNEIGIPNGRAFSKEGEVLDWYPSQYLHLKQIFLDIMRPNEKAIKLLGPDLADRVDVFQKVRKLMTPRLEDGKGIFPLNSMPCMERGFDGTFPVVDGDDNDEE